MFDYISPYICICMWLYNISCQGIPGVSEFLKNSFHFYFIFLSSTHFTMSVDNIVFLKSHAAANDMYSTDKKHEPFSADTSSTTPNWLKLCCFLFDHYFTCLC